MRGFVGGMIWGVVTSGIGLSVVSLTAPLAPRPDVAVQANTNEIPEAVARESDTSDTRTTRKDPQLVEAAPIVPDPDEAAASAERTALADTNPGTKPNAAQEPVSLAKPTDPISTELDVAVEGRPQSTPQAPVAPLAPQSESDSPLDVAVDIPAQQPTAPEVSESGSGFGAAPRADDAPDVAAKPDAALSDVAAADVVAPAAESGPGVQTAPLNSPNVDPVDVAAAAPSEQSTPYLTSTLSLIHI